MRAMSFNDSMSISWIGQIIENLCSHLHVIKWSRSCVFLERWSYRLRKSEPKFAGSSTAEPVNVLQANYGHGALKLN